MSNLSQLALNDEGFAFNPTTGDSYQISSTGVVILAALRENKSDDVIAQSLTEKFDVTLVDAQHDVADFKASLKNLGLL